MKKKLAILLAMCLVAGTFHGTVEMPEVKAAEIQQEADTNSNFTYIVIGNNSVEIAGYTGQETELIIPSEIDGKTVKNIGMYSFYGCSDLTSVKIPSGVTSIGSSAFKGCSSLTSIEIPSEVTSIGSSAFKGCSGLTSIEIPSEVTSIGDFAFAECSSLTSIEIPSGVTSIGDFAFAKCNGLTSIEIPPGVTSIGKYAFFECSSLTSVEIPSGVTSIGNSAFAECSSLTSVEIPSGVTSIGDFAFFGCRGLTIYCSKGSYAEQYAKENNFAVQDISETPGQKPDETPGDNTPEEPGKDPSENPGTEPPETPGQKPTEKPGNDSVEKPTLSLDGKIIQTITAEDIVKTMGDQPFYLDAETDGDGTLTYKSKNPDIVKVDGTGKATIVSAGTAKISVTASATDTYSSAKKMVTVTVIPEGYTPIYDIYDLYAIRNNPSGNYILVDDIDMSATQKGGDFDCGTGWDSIEEFWGILDGNGHRIVGMHIFGEFTYRTAIGLFESCATASIKNLAIVDCDINIVAIGEGLSLNLGTISGGGGNIENCYSSGKIAIQRKSTDYSGCVGGLIGLGGDFKNCFSTCEIDCDYTDSFCRIGGITGFTSSIVRCYNVGNIKGNGNSNIGSVCGEFSRGLGSAYENLCYLKGTAAKGIGGYYTDNPDCVALTEAQMKNPKLFTGFDFTNTWEVDPYCSYPYPQLKNNRMIRIDGIRLDTAPSKLTYNQGESLKLSGAALEVSYEDGINTSIPLEKNMLSGYDMNKIGQQTVTVSYGGEETSFDIEVREVSVAGISIPRTLSLNRSKQKQLTASITPVNASDKSVTWKSDNPSVASVSSSGLVKAKARGTAVITATASNGVQAKCKVTVLVPAVSVKLSHSSLSMAAGSQRSIKAQILPLESTDSVNWKSSNTAVAEVYDGSIHAKKEGTAKITAYTKSGAKASCTVTVKKSGNGASSEIKKITSKKAKIKSAKNVKKKRVTLKLSGSVNGSGYKIQYGTNRKFKGAKTVTAKGSTTTIKKLKAKKTYYIRTRIYKKISGKTYYGKWSSVKSVKVKK